MYSFWTVCNLEWHCNIHDETVPRLIKHPKQSIKGFGAALHLPPTHWTANILLLHQLQRASFTETKVVARIAELIRPSLQTCHTRWHTQLHPVNATARADIQQVLDDLMPLLKLLLLLSKCFPLALLLQLLSPLLLGPAEKDLQLDRAYSPRFELPQPPGCQRLAKCLSPR